MRTAQDSAPADTHRDAFRSIRLFLRFLYVIAVSVRVLISYKGHNLFHLLSNDDVKAEALESLHEKNSLRITKMCRKLKGGTLKLAQFLSCRSDILPKAYIQQFATLQDQVPPLPFSKIEKHLADQLDQPIESIFKYIDKNATACASIAQVHRATLITGEDVAIKIQLPGVDKLIQADLNVILACISILKGVLSQLNFSSIVEQLRSAILDELDFTFEAVSLSKFGQQFADKPDVVVPRIYPQHCSKKLIVMEFIEGTKITDHLDKCKADNNKDEVNRVLSNFVDCYSCQIFQNGYFHCDPHPGNFLIDKLGRLVLLDFGSVHSFSKQEINNYQMLSFMVLCQNRDAVCSLLTKMDFKSSDDDPTVLLAFTDVIFSVMQKEFSGDYNSIDLSIQMERILGFANTNQSFSIPQNFVLLARVLLSLGGYLYTYQPTAELFPILSRYLAPQAVDQTPSLATA